ncbi:hypothetical protein [Mycolicibacterium sp. PDY-3]|uniref:hypothetical protein n=1 Tax=Mycolicibacterium sp. PDY-3 TaxID=3376069 RepID=UPI0037B992DB
MDEATMRSVIANELKELRKGGGVPSFDMRGNTLLTVAYNRHNSLMRSSLEDELYAMRRETGAGALVAALAIGTRDKWPNLNDMPYEELTLRRRSYAERTNVSERTLSRHEDEAIETLSRRLASRFREEPYRSRIAKDYSAYAMNERKSESKPDASAANRRYTMGGNSSTGQSDAKQRASCDTPPDLKGMLKQQQMLINDVQIAYVGIQNILQDLQRTKAALDRLNAAIVEHQGLTLD